MSITEGDISANFRFNNRTGLLVPETITDERQVVAALPEFSGDYGFTLNETPQTDIAGITQVKRISDNQIFTHTALATVGLTEYFFDYQNDMPILFFNAANDGEEFQIQYFGVGGAVNAKNLTAVADIAIDAAVATIDAQITAIESDITAIETELSDIAGLIIGGIEFNTGALPPKIKAGSYDVSGAKVKVSSDTSLALADVMQQGKNTFDIDVHYLVCMNSSGDKKYILYGEGAVSNGTITSITSSGTTYTLTVATGTVGAHTDKILVIEGNNNINGVFKITGGDSATTYTFTTQSGFTNGGASGTWRVLDIINTLHGTGSATAITGVFIRIYSASVSENGAASIAAFSQSKNGFYLTLDGLTDYRVLGSFLTSITTVVNKSIFSYKSGRDKNDNFFKLRRVASKVTNALRWSTFQALYGCDYVFVDSAGVGSEFTAQRDMRVSATFNGYGVSAWTSELSILDSTTNTNNNTRDNSVAQHGAASSSSTITIPSTAIYKNQILKPMGSVDNGNDIVRLIGSFTI